MSKRKKNTSAAENLIESLMEDLKDIQSESIVGGAPAAPNVPWEDGFEAEIDSSEFTGRSLSEYGNKEQGYEDGDQLLDGEAPDGFMDAAEESHYKIPSVEAEFQAPDDLFSAPQVNDREAATQMASSAIDDSTKPVFSSGSVSDDDKDDRTVSIQQDINQSTAAVASQATQATMNTDADKTLAVDGFANARKAARKKANDVDVKVSVGSFRGNRSGNVMTSVDASLAQAENLKLAQQRILELEKEVEFLRAENEELASAGEIIRSRTDELSVRISSIEKEKAEIQESAQSELLILKGNLQYKENEVAKARIKIDELETRLKSDFKKIRVRERELENRLELLRAEKSALIRSKDEYILDQKRKIDQLSQELDNYRKKCLELNRSLEANQDQFKRTERALRLALSNLEVKEENLTPLKKAE